jgi:hypothetical protein
MSPMAPAQSDDTSSGVQSATGAALRVRWRVGCGAVAAVSLPCKPKPCVVRRRAPGIPLAPCAPPVAPALPHAVRRSSLDAFQGGPPGANAGKFTLRPFGGDRAR